MDVKNLIFYGPPGTGKTYLATYLAVALAENRPEEDLHRHFSRQQVQQKFLRLQQEGRIATVTFHQSFSYEDFVEGFKPFKNQDQALYYDVEDGVFKQICYNAAYALLLAQQRRSLQAARQNRKSNFQHLHFEFVDYLQRMMRAGSKEVVFETPTQKALTLENINQQGTLELRYEPGKRTYRVTRNKLADMYRKFPDPTAIELSALKALLKQQHVAVYQAVFVRFKAFEATRQRSYNYILHHRQFQGQQVTEEQYQRMKREITQLDYTALQPEDHAQAGRFVLLIDEINRGNVAGILGELITLLEADKRAGMPQALYTMLPYSRERFTVPPNLHIVGTMNTADRSVEALDTALRRRFFFREVLPQPELLAWPATPPPASTAAEPSAEYHTGIFSVDLPRLLTTLNRRLAALLDHDHILGHGYLMPVLQAEDPAKMLHQIFYAQLIPLLQEFFFQDLRNLARVLGQSFLETSDASLSFAQTQEDTAQFTQPVYRIRSMTGSSFIQAVKQIYETGAERTDTPQKA